jgi:signal transduction histidine kinase/HAMP domain-containing protein
MKDSRLAMRLRDMPLRTQLMVQFAFLSIFTTAVSTVTLTTLNARRMHAELQERAQRMARRLQVPLEAATAADQKRIARQFFDLYAGDNVIDGMAVYSDDGEPLEKRGSAPEHLGYINEELNFRDGRLIAVEPFQALDGRLQRIYLGFSSRSLDVLLRREVWISAGIGILIALCALLLAARTSRRMSRRLVCIVEAADWVAAGDTTHPPIDDQARDEIGELAQSFNIMVQEMNRVSGEYDQLALTEKAQLEAVVSARTQEVEQSREMFRLIAESTSAIPFTLDLSRGCFTYIGARAIAESGIPEPDWRTPGALESIIPRPGNPDIRQRLDACRNGPFDFVSPLVRRGNRRAEMRWTGSCEIVANSKIFRGLMLDITELRRLGREQAAMQKLESVGRLAAGVAHEINTPVQFVSDNVQFVRSSMTDLSTVIGAYRQLQQAVNSGGDSIAAASLAAEAEKTADLDYILENVPLAVESSIDGLGRIATIVRSMKEFAHPDQAQKTPADLNQAIRSTLVIAHNEYKYIADVETQYGDLPLVQCHLGEINQVVLNLLVNASHAMAESHAAAGNADGNSERGKLTVITRRDGDAVEISIADTGAGIPEEIRDRIFDPFFTTKEVGKGTGQGLALAHSAIVVKHGGTLRFESECGKGTTFFIRLPVNAPESAAAAAA